MTCRRPKYAARNVVEFALAGCPVPLAIPTAPLGVIIAPPAVADAGCDSVSATRFFFDLTE